ncbi:hypothetical protein SAMN05421507_10880 [Lentzea jiangxiensis]|uniref:Uncharacterized protein n=1 Tax=Lentzea jiangxiensis TaxID=641025 RepID=A0A1H0SHQ5_9PSEU|nr:hypothetical protein SAMN05421507_10880 [Lentzea jiangxiensis]
METRLPGLIHPVVRTAGGRPLRWITAITRGENECGVDRRPRKGGRDTTDSVSKRTIGEIDRQWTNQLPVRGCDRLIGARSMTRADENQTETAKSGPFCGGGHYGLLRWHSGLQAAHRCSCVRRVAPRPSGATAGRPVHLIATGRMNCGDHAESRRSAANSPKGRSDGKRRPDTLRPAGTSGYVVVKLPVISCRVSGGRFGKGQFDSAFARPVRAPLTSGSAFLRDDGGSPGPSEPRHGGVLRWSGD